MPPAEPAIVADSGEKRPAATRRVGGVAPVPRTSSELLAHRTIPHPVFMQDELPATLVASRPPISFGPFRLIPGERRLLCNGQPVRLGGRALDVLIALVEHAGGVVSHDELMRRLWPEPGSADPSCLRAHVAALRRALEDGEGTARYIANVPGRGYRFTAQLNAEVDAPITAEVAAHAASTARHLPPQLTRMIGREQVVETIAAQLAEWSFVTVVGPGGIGKTTVALAAAEQVASRYADGRAYVDLSPLTDPSLVAAKVAAAVGVGGYAGDVLPGLVGSLRRRNMLIVIDTCEHLVDAVATVAEAIAGSAPGVDILATSREPLRAIGERVYRLPALGVPPPAPVLTAIDALTYPAVQLFADRARASLAGFDISDANATIVADICRRLDGIALAIEFAAGRIDAFSVDGLAALLDDRFKLLTRGRSTALPRHRTLCAALDWSYELLPEAERRTLASLGVFAGHFDLDAAVAVADDDDAFHSLANLVGKSLLTADTGSSGTQYRLLDTTRAYARDKLQTTGELDAAARRHARYYCRLLGPVATDWASREKAAWQDLFRRHLDNVRIALDWALSSEGDGQLALELSVATIPLWFHLSLAYEGSVRMRRALELAPPGSVHEMQLRAALGWMLMQTEGPVPEMRASWQRAAELGMALGHTEYAMRASFNLWIYHFCLGEFREALRVNACSQAIVDRENDSVGRLTIGHQLGITHTFMGNLVLAREHLEQTLASYRDSHQRIDDLRMVHDQRSSIRSFIARVLWLHGHSDRALAMIAANLADRGTNENAFALMSSLQHGLPVVIEAGDFATADRMIERLHDEGTRNGLQLYQNWADRYRAELEVRRGNLEGNLEALRAALTNLSGQPFGIYRLPQVATLSAGLLAAGQTQAALATIDEAMAEAERTEEQWCLPEFQRIRANILAALGRTEDAKSMLQKSIALARAQGAVSWELRSSSSLAALLSRG